MKRKETKHGQTTLSEQEFLRQLGRYLLFYFPVKQVSEILADYQEYFQTEAENRDMNENVSRWGTPKEVTKALLEENPLARQYICKWSAFWGTALLLSLSCLLYSGCGIFITLILIPLSLFGLFHGWNQMKMEADFPEETDHSKKFLAIHCLVPIVVFFLEAEMQFFMKQIGNMPLYIGSLPIGPAIDMEYAFFQFLFFLLLIQAIKRAVTASIQYICGTAHALGAMVCIMDIRNSLHRMDLSIDSSGLGRLFIFSLVYYGIGLGLSCLFWLASMYSRNLKSGRNV